MHLRSLLRFSGRRRLLGLAVAAAWFGAWGGLPASAAEPLGIYLPEASPPPAPKVVAPRKIRETYADGSTRVEREALALSDDQLINHGAYTEYYANGQKFAEGRYEQGVYDGEWTFWHDNGQLCKKVAFRKGVPDGDWEVYRADGSLMARKSYAEGRRRGKWQHFFEDGQTLKLEQSYADDDDERELRTTYYPSGKPRQTAELRQGKLEGTIVEYDEAGRKRTEFTLVDGKLHGQLKRWDEDGTQSIQHFDHGKQFVPPAG